MDPLAHTLAGTLLGKSHPSKAKGLVLACVLGAVAPDIDIVLTLWGRDFYITEHRGFTHSLLGLLPVSLLSAWVAYLFVRQFKDRASFQALLGMAGLGVVSHDLLDWCTSWGTMLFWPNRTRYSLDHLFIVDPWYWALLALPVTATFLFKEHRLRLCWAGFMVVLGYHGLAAYNHWKALRIVESDRPQAWRAAFPQPFSPFRWSAYNRADGLLKNARIDFLLDPQPLEWKQWQEPPATPELKAAQDSANGRKYLWFARVPMWEEVKQPDGSFLVNFWDMRFSNEVVKDKFARRFGAKFVVQGGQVTGGGL
jgi:inner membrane protein